MRVQQLIFCVFVCFACALYGQSALDVLIYIGGYDQNSWQQTLDAPFAVKSFSGTFEKGVVAFGGLQNKQGAFVKDINNGRWEMMADAPFAVIRCAGDNLGGPLIFGGANNTQVAYMRDYKKNTWNVLKAAPFAIADIAGDNLTGPVIAGGTHVAVMRDFNANEWIRLPTAPFEISCIAGDNVKGVIAAGGQNNRQVAIFRDFSANKWQVLSNAPFEVFDVSGSNVRGPMIVGGAGNMQVAFMDDYKMNKWKLIPNAIVSAVEIAGTNDTGAIIMGKKGGITGSGGSLNKKIRQQVLKTAVVEFSQRGNLGIDDAGAIITEWLTTALNKTGGFEVYERLSLETLMKEHELGMSGMMDDETIAEIGRLKGVQAIVTGSVFKFGDIVSVTAKVVDVATAKIIKSADIKVSDVNAVSTEIESLAWELAKE